MFLNIIIDKRRKKNMHYWIGKHVHDSEQHRVATYLQIPEQGGPTIICHERQQMNEQNEDIPGYLIKKKLQGLPILT